MNIEKQTILQPYTDAEFEIILENLERQELSLIEIKAKQHGPIHEPLTLQHYYIKIIRPLKDDIQKVIDMNYARYQPVSNVALIQNLRTNANDKIHELTREKNDKAQKLGILESEQESLKKKINGNISSKLRRMIPIGFGIGEGGLTILMAQSEKLPTIFSLLLGLLAALAAGIGIHVSANFICKAKTPFQKRIRIAIVILAAFLFALSLGIWRANVYSEVSKVKSEVDLNNPTNHSTSYSPWPFVVISFVAFLVALGFEIKYWITDAERKQMRLYEEKCSEVYKTQQEHDNLKKEIDSIERNLAENSALTMQKHEYAYGNEKRLLTLANRVISRYESINVDCRKDRRCPPFFNQRIDFGFTFYFNPIFNFKTTSNEKSNGAHSSAFNELMSE